MMQMIRAIANTLKGNIFIPSMRYPATEDDLNDMVAETSKWISDPRYSEWRVELCSCELIDDEITHITIIRTWEITN